MSLPANVFWVSKSLHPGCAASLLLTVGVPRGIDDYEAAVYANVGLGTRWWTKPGQKSIPIFNGLETYHAPSGSVVFGVGGGNGGGDCTANATPKNWLGEAAWGITYKWLVDGHVTVAGSGTRAAKIRMAASCPGGGTTTTDTNGYYEFLVDKNTTCTVAPRLINGLQSAPRQRVVQVHNSDVHHVDFQVPCDALPTTSRDIASAAAASGNACKLLVFVKEIDPLRSGLAYHSPHPHYRYYPVDFVGKSLTILSGRNAVCESGCTDLRITVRDGQTNKPVPGALVKADVGVPEPRVAGDGSLCLEDSQGLTDTSKPCDRDLPGLTTDSKGQVWLRYWAPAVVADASTTLTVTARKACSAYSCPLHVKQGSAKPTHLKIKPYVIYQHPSTLTDTEEEILAKWAVGEDPLISLLVHSATANKLLIRALTWLNDGKEEGAVFTESLETLERAELVLVPAELYEYWNYASERAALLAEFLRLNGLSAFGLGSDPSEAEVTHAPTFTFDHELVDFGNFVPFHVLGVSGAWWDLAEKVGRSYEHHGEVHAALELKVYETSYCEPSKGVCDPGYANDPGSATVLRPGIQAQLTFRLILVLGTKKAFTVDEKVFDTPYDAIAWEETQGHLSDVIKDF